MHLKSLLQDRFLNSDPMLPSIESPQDKVSKKTKREIGQGIKTRTNGTSKRKKAKHHTLLHFADTDL